MKKHVYIVIIFLLIQLPCFSMKKLFSGRMHTESEGHSESEVLVNRVQLVNQQEKNLPTVYVISLARTLKKNPKEFLDLPVPFPQGTMREFINYQAFHDEYREVGKEERTKAMNDAVSSILFENDELLSQAVIRLCKPKFTGGFFSSIRMFLKKKIGEKIRNEQSDRKQVWYESLQFSCVGLNIGIVASLGAWWTYQKNENKIAGYFLLGSSMLGGLVILPKLYKSYNALRSSKRNLKDYDVLLKILDEKCDESFEIRHITNEALHKIS